MHPFPHRYRTVAEAHPTGEVAIASPGLVSLATAPPREFGGPGDRWSPETLLVAAVADRLVLTFRGVARAARYDWTALECAVEGLLERPANDSRFTAFTIRARLEVPAGADPRLGEQLLAKAERGCLISNSLSGAKALEAAVVVSACVPARAEALV